MTLNHSVFQRLLLLLATLLWSSICFAFATVTPADLNEGFKLRDYESWPQLSNLTEHVVSDGCLSQDIACIQMLLMHAESLFGQPSEINTEKANKILAQLSLLISELPRDKSKMIEDNALLITAFGKRKSNSLDLSESRNILKRLLARSPSQDTRIRTLCELAYVTRQQGDKALSRELYGELLLLSQKTDNFSGVMCGRIGLALIDNDDENYDKAINNFEQILKDIVRPNQPTLYLRKASFIHGNLGALYKEIGQYENSQKNYKLAVLYMRQIDPIIYRTDWVDSLASSYRLLGNYEKSLQLLNDEFFKFRPENTKRDYFAYREMALDLSAKGDWLNAKLTMQKALDLRKDAKVFRKIGEYYADLSSIQLENNDIDESIQTAFNGLTLAINTEDTRSEWQNTFCLFRGFRSKNETQLAIYWGKRSINILQQLRSQMKETDTDDHTQATYLRKVQYIYEELTALLIKSGRLSEAEEVTTLLKENELFELTRTSNRLNSLSLNSAEALWDQTVTDFKKIIIKLGNLPQKSMFQNNESKKERDDRVQAIQDRLIKEQDSFGEQLNTIRQSIMKNSVLAVESGGSNLGEANFNNFNRVLRGNGDGYGYTGLSYIVAPDGIFIIVSNPKQKQTRVQYVDISPEKLNTLLFKLSQDMKPKFNHFGAISFDDSKTKATSNELYNILIKPVEKDILDSNTHTIILSLTGILRYLPFNALYDGKSYLIEKWATAMYASSGSIGIQSKINASKWKVAGFGLTREIKVTEGNGFRKFTALSSVKNELLSIIRSKFSPVGFISGEVLLNKDFNRSSLEQASARYNVLHIATHYQYEPTRPFQSYLLLGDGTLFHIKDFKSMNLEKVDLVTLSACDTANGQSISQKGQEVETLAAQIQSLGAKSVLASLWRVNDLSTSVFMENFYKNRISKSSNNLGSAKSLQKTQLLFINSKQSLGSDISTNKINQDYSQPYYWAPFVLIGNWR